MSLGKRLAIFIPSLRAGGAERIALNLAHGLQSRGKNLDLVVGTTDGPLLAEVRPEIRLIDLSASTMPRAIIGLVRYLKDSGPDIILSMMDSANVTAIFGAKLSGLHPRIVVRSAGTLSFSYHNPESVWDLLMPAMIRRLYREAAIVIAVSNGVAEDLVQMTGIARSKIAVVYNPVVSPELVARAQEDPHHPWFGPAEPPVIISCGRLTPAKDFPTLIRAFRIIKSREPLRLMILGEGPERAKLEALVERLGLRNQVAIPGYLPNPHAYVSRSKLYVSSSISEGLPSAIVEALALGVPVVATDCPSGPSEILDHGKYGTLVPPGDPDVLARAMSEALTRGSVYSDMRARSESFSEKRGLDLYERILYAS